MTADPVFTEGQAVVCVRGHGYLLTEGKEYTVLRYEPSCPEPAARYTWPAYVHFIDDTGKKCICHAYRFRPK